MQPASQTLSRNEEQANHSLPGSGAPAAAPAPGAIDRLAAAAGGTALLAYAARHRSWRGVAAALAAAPLVYRGVRGRWPVPRGIARRAAQAVALTPVEVEDSVTVERDAAELYAFWRRLENLPRFMANLKSVSEEPDGRSRWVAVGPLGKTVEWQAEVIEDRPGQLLSWRSLPGSQVDTAGSVLFEPTPGARRRGTVVRVTMELAPPLKGFGKAVAKMLSPLTRQQVHADLVRFKNLMEAEARDGYRSPEDG